MATETVSPELAVESGPSSNVRILPSPSAAAGVAKEPREPRVSQKWRGKYSREAACEISSISNLLQTMPEMDSELVRCLGIRLDQLSGVILSSFDSSDREENVYPRLYGPELGRARFHADAARNRGDR